VDDRERSCAAEDPSAHPPERPITYLRLSITDRCNLRCVYCMPPEGIPLFPQEAILRHRELLEILGTVVGPLGIKGVRITGGEPLVRGGVEELVAGLAAIPGLEDVSLTTNGILLAGVARRLKDAGLRRVNVSLDTLDESRYRAICRGGEVAQVFQGIRAAEEAGLSPIKLNMVVIPGLNDDEVERMAALTLAHPWHVRFIEFMPVGNDGLYRASHHLPTVELLRRLMAVYPLQPAEKPYGLGPARYWRIEGARGLLGFISPLSEHFCYTCNRIRLTADGWARVCLLNDTLGVDVKTPYRAGARGEALTALFRAACAMKPSRHGIAAGREERFVKTMCQIGG
jgi:cyclic pyranopterin phosphate synthase